MKRFIEQSLQEWRTRKDRKPLILKGLRQCGKTYCLQNFGKNQFPKTHYLNFEQHEKVCRSLFDGSLEPRRIVNELSFYLDQKIDIEKDLVIFDEIQACPKALTSLKYFQEQMPQLALASAGSLLGLHLNSGSFPVGKVDFLHLYPMSFLEFLMAIDDSKSLEFITQYKSGDSVSELVHQHLWERLKWYFVIGGLPEVVKLFRDQHHNLYEAFSNVRQKQSELIAAYYADIAKHSGKENAMHIDRVWRSTPQQLARTSDSAAPRFQFTNVVPGIDRYQRLAGAIDWLESAGLIIKTSIISHVEQPLSAYSKESLFKLYSCDVGLLGAMSDLDPGVILKYDYGTYKGYFAENFVAQEFLAKESKLLYCWQQNRSEVEFLQVVKENIILVEVKAGHITRAKSLEKYKNLFNPIYEVVLNAALPKIDETRRYYPLYLASQIF